MALNPRSLWAVSSSPNRVRKRIIRIKPSARLERTSISEFGYLVNHSQAGERWTDTEKDVARVQDPSELAVVVGLLIPEAMPGLAAEKFIVKPRPKISGVRALEELRNKLETVVPNKERSIWTVVQKIQTGPFGRRVIGFLDHRDDVTGVCEVRRLPGTEKARDCIIAYYDEWVKMPPSKGFATLRSDILENVTAFCRDYLEENWETEDGAGGDSDGVAVEDTGEKLMDEAGLDGEVDAPGELVFDTTAAMDSFLRSDSGFAALDNDFNQCFTLPTIDTPEDGGEYGQVNVRDHFDEDLTLSLLNMPETVPGSVVDMAVFDVKKSMESIEMVIVHVLRPAVLCLFYCLVGFLSACLQQGKNSMASMTAPVLVEEEHNAQPGAGEGQTENLTGDR